ncbi:hypothetical protein N3K66_000055 [Trichothecium roseum]|uniref:Uncharacterized protein n=1 Tax=Trichothecium roseum TaxID=47278 RepID=A0ACC0VAU2_9HYPO|nr:hypothetical protein N3K66_000055 [Trichothecium roseum]
MADQKIDVLLYGLGAIGSFYAFILSRSENVRLTVVARSNYDAVAANGLRIISQNHGEHLVKPHKVLRKVADAGMTFDYVVCAHKAIYQDTVPEQIAAGVDGGKTTVVIIQNGVGNEEPFRDSFPSATIISCVTWVGARQSEPGVVEHTKSEDMQIGLFANASGDAAADAQRLDAFAGLLTAGGTVFQAVPDIQLLRWEKVVWNAAWNSLTTLTLADTHAWLVSSESAEPMTRRLMGEVMAVGRALGVPLADDLPDRLMGRIRALPPIGSSMRADYEAGRPLEVEIILGYPVRKGKELGVPVPIVETLYVLLTAVNKRLIAASKM